MFDFLVVQCLLLFYKGEKASFPLAYTCMRWYLAYGQFYLCTALTAQTCFPVIWSPGSSAGTVEDLGQEALIGPIHTLEETFVDGRTRDFHNARDRQSEALGLFRAEGSSRARSEEPAYTSAGLENIGYS